MHENCRQCAAPFEITDRDLGMYDRFSPVFGGKKISVPPPALCPDCRQKRRLAFRNERNLYADTCDLCGKPIISLYSPDKPYKVYCQPCWWGDGWDGTDYGRSYDSKRPFFEQFRELQLEVPRPAIFNVQSINSEYANHSARNKNCYMGVAFGDCEDCMYSHWLLHSKDSLDMLYCEHCTECYECSYCRNCTRTFFSQYCRNTHDSIFCFECMDCENCIGCVQLRHKKYHIFNEPVSRQEFEKTRKEILTSHRKFLEAEESFRELMMKSPRRATLQVNCQDSTGDDLNNCKNARHCFNCRNLEDCEYMYDLGDLKDSMDCYEHGWLVPGELNYELHAGMAGQHLLFCNICAEARDLIYSDICFNNSTDLFGCVGLKKKNHCVLNRRYAKEEYEKLVPQIIELMRRDGEWGEFFPVALSPFGYNETTGPQYYQMKKDEALAKGFKWSDHQPPKTGVAGVVRRSALPDDILEVSDDILESAVTGETSDKPFKVIKKELEFYRKLGLPLPRKHPDERHDDRFALRNPRRLWDRACAKCGSEILTNCAPGRPETVYCEKCYLKAVY